MERSNQAKIPETVILWLDRELELTEEEYQELLNIKELANNFNSLVIPHSVLPRKRIDIKKSTLLKKLIRDGYCSLGLTEIEIRPRKILKDEADRFNDYIENRYAKILSGQSPLPPFPSAVFTEVSNISTEIAVSDLAAYSEKKLARFPGYIRLFFSDDTLPDILITGSVINELKEMCIIKIREYLAELSGSNPDYYSDKIQLYKNRFRGRALELIEMDIGKLKHRTEKKTREDIARIVISHIGNEDEALESFIMDTLSSENRYILTRFTKDHRGDFDFFQSVYALYNGILNKTHHHSINNTSLLQAIKQSLSGFVTVSELKTAALKANPEVKSYEFDDIYRTFENAYVGLSTSLPTPLVLKQPINKGNIREEYLIHVGNLDGFLETRLIKASEEIREIIKKDWKEKLQRHSFDEGMFNDSVFRKQLEFLLEQNFFTLFCFLHNENIDKYIVVAGILSPRVKLLHDNGFNRLDLCLKIDRDELYQLVNQAIISPLTQFSKLLFRFFHWISRSIYFHRPEIDRKRESIPQKKEKLDIPANPDITPVTVKVPRVLRHCGCSSEDELKEKTDSLWNRIPEKNLQRDDVEQNILRDLNSFFADKELVYFSSLEFLIDTNLNRILSKGAHLVPYSETLRDFIVHHICFCIYVDSYMRGKIRFKKQ